MSMNPEIKKQWVAALRSGEYQQQSESRLHDVGPDGTQRYCCLGVLSALAAEAGACNVWQVGEAGDRVFYYDGDSAYPPASVVSWAGLDNRSPLADGRELATLNDTGTPFAEIADLIESSDL